MKRNSFQAVLFDLDGTLLDTIQDLADSMNVALKAAGYPEHPVDAYKYFVGDGMENLVKRSLPKSVQDRNIIETLLDRLRKEYTIRQSINTKPYDGIKELLLKLRKNNIRLAVLSNKPDEFTPNIIKSYFPDVSFDVVRGQKSGVPKKPDPAGALDIAGILHFHPSEFAYLGDTDTDMKTAVSAGMFAVGAAWGFRPVSELLENGARKIIQHPLELLSLWEE
jgi:phosphoglycolate phosphatase